MNYLCQYVESREYFVISSVTKDYTSYIGDKTKTISYGGPFFRVIQEIEIR